MERYLARFGDDPSIKGAVVSTFNGTHVRCFESAILTNVIRWMFFRRHGRWVVCDTHSNPVYI